MRSAGGSHEVLDYPALHIVNPSESHKQTVLMVHGLGSSGPKFEAAFFASKTSQDFRQRFPHTRWVFPSAPMRHVKVWNDVRPAWFDVASLSNLEEDQQAQVQGLKESTGYLSQVLETEVAGLLDAGRGGKDLFVIARSQGSSAMIWTLLSSLKQTIGGIVLAGSWLVFARALQEWLRKVRAHDGAEPEVRTAAMRFVDELLTDSETKLLNGCHPLQHTPVLMGHCIKDKWIGIELGRQMRETLQHVGCSVTWNEYSDAAEDGHWLAEPEEFNAIATFLESRMNENQSP